MLVLASQPTPRRGGKVQMDPGTTVRCEQGLIPLLGSFCSGRENLPESEREEDDMQADVVQIVSSRSWLSRCGELTLENVGLGFEQL